MPMYCTVIKYVDPNGYGIVSYYMANAKDVNKAHEKALNAFMKDKLKMYGTMDNIDLEYSTEEVKPGFFMERTWRRKV